VDNDGAPAFLCTGGRDGRQSTCLATAGPDLLSLNKYPGNPVIPGPPEGMTAVGFRDHTVWREGGMWHQLIGSGIEGVGGTVLL
jgi:beta-fructofuranosidase